MALALHLEPLFDRVLVRAGERSEYELASVRMAGMHRQISAGCNRINDSLHVAEVELSVNTLRVLVQSESDEIDDPCTLSITKEAALDTITTR